MPRGIRRASIFIPWIQWEGLDTSGITEAGGDIPIRFRGGTSTACEATRDPVLLVSRPEELDKLDATACRLFPRCLSLREAAETEDGEDLSQKSNVFRGLHAKVYISQNGGDTTITLGSANATSAALVGGRNAVPYLLDPALVTYR